MGKAVGIPYGDEVIPVRIDDANLQGVVYPNQVEIADELETIKDAVANPIDSESFGEFLSDQEDILFIVNDATRPTPTAKILDILYEEIRNRNVKFVVATGVHREPTLDEYRHLFGRYYGEFGDRIYAHDSRKDEDMVYLGKSRNGTEMWVNKLAAAANKIVIVGSVEPHYFGGFTGGRKSLLPGVSAYRTIEQNHRMALSPKARVLALEGNPVNEDMEDAVDALSEKDLFCIMTVVDRDQRVYSATAGDIRGSFRAATEKAKEVFCVKVDGKADIVLSAVSRPLDTSLYQSQKALYNAIHVLREDGIFILVSACREGVGPEEYVELLRSCRSPREVLERVEREYKLGYHQGAKIAEISLWAKIWAVTRLDGEAMGGLFVRPFSDPQSALDAAIREKGKDSKVLFLMDGAVTVPMLN